MAKIWHKYRPGDVAPVSASLMNTVVDHQEMVGRMWNKQGARPFRQGVQPDIIYVRNDSGAVRNRWDVLGLGGVIFNHAANAENFEARQLVFKGDSPVAGHAGKYCILLEGLQAGAIGRAAIDGIWPAQVNFTSTTDTLAEIEAGSYHLKSGTSGSASIIATETPATGLQWTAVKLSGIVQVSAPTIIVGKLNEALSAGYSAQMSIWTLNAGQTNWVTQSADTLVDQIVYAPPVLRTGSIASGKWVEAMLGADGLYWVRWAEC